jgi:hypothetical protein
MLRKHINTIKRDQLYLLPFYSWNCITIKLKHRDVDLVIKDEKQMDILLKFLVYTLKTLDGYKDTAVPLLTRLIEISKREFK